MATVPELQPVLLRSGSILSALPLYDENGFMRQDSTPDDAILALEEFSLMEFTSPSADALHARAKRAVPYLKYFINETHAAGRQPALGIMALDDEGFFDIYDRYAEFDPTHGFYRDTDPLTQIDFPDGMFKLIMEELAVSHEVPWHETGPEIYPDSALKLYLYGPRFTSKIYQSHGHSSNPTAMVDSFVDSTP
jgi:hypothetical protein